MSDRANKRIATGRVCEAYLQTAIATSIAWAVGVFVLLLAHVLLSRYFAYSAVEVLVVAMGSLLVAHLSLLPGLRLSVLGGGFYQAMLTGITIRMIGTVALFLSCRYQLASSADLLAGMVIGWYVLLTTIEVIALSRRLPLSRHASTASCSSEMAASRPELEFQVPLSVRPVESES